MSILLTFGPVAMTREEYLSIGDRVPEPPDGRDYHVCAGDDGALYFVEVWESEAAMEAWNERVIPVIRDLFGDRQQVDELPEGYAVRPVVSIHRPGEMFVRPS